jgi:hypothetical protein
VTNIGSVPVDDPESVLEVGRGADPDGFVAPPEIGRLEPGESTTVSVDVELPVFAIGTYAVEGSFPGFDPPVEFRAESSHIPWLLLLLPLVILGLVALIALWNRIRRRTREPGEQQVLRPTPEAAPVAATAVIDLRHEEPSDEDAEVEELASVITEELDAAFDDVLFWSGDELTNENLADLVVGLSHTAGKRVAGRTSLTLAESEGLGDEIAGELLAALGIEGDTSARL